MSPDKLLAELDTLSHDGRMRRMVELGRLGVRDTEIAQTIAAMATRGVYERRLALHSCFGSCDGAHALRAISDPSRTVRGLAMTLIPRVCGDGQAMAALGAVTRDGRLCLLRRMRRCRRIAPIDAFLDELARKGDDAFAELLPFGGPACVARHLALANRRGGTTFFLRLSTLHPTLAADLLRRQAEAATGPDPILLLHANAALPALAHGCADEALALVGALMRHVPIGRLSLHALSRWRPASVAELVLGSPDPGGVSLDLVAHLLPTDQLLALLHRQPSVVAAHARWFHRLPPDRRSKVFSVCRQTWRNQEGCISPAILMWLPAEVRHPEARRHLALPALSTRPQQRLLYAGLLPWDEARAALAAWLGHPDGELRGLALRSLTQCVRYERARLDELLGLLASRKNEQDPVRNAILSGLAGLPPGAFRKGQLDSLGQVLRDALHAADLSQGTASVAERLVLSLLPHQPVFAAGWLQTLVKERGQVSFSDLERRLTPKDVERVAPLLLPVLKAWEDRDRQRHLLAAAQSLGRRLRLFPPLGEILERVAKESPWPWAGQGALDLLRQHARPRFIKLVPRLLSEDPSWSTVPSVHNHLHRRRQDLLTPYLGQRAYKGRFATGKTRFVLPFTRGFQRWTPSQQCLFAATLDDLLTDRERSTPEILRAITRLAALSMVPPRHVIEPCGDSRPPVREAAVRALGRLDAGQGVPALLEMLGDDRARIAIYALRRCVLQMAPAAAVGVLRGVPLGKVTVAKEVIRLLGELPGDEPFRELLSMDGKSIHRDVRVALLRGLWGHLSRTEAWDLLMRAALSEDAALAQSLVHLPVDRLTPEGQRRALEMLGTLICHRAPEVRLEVLRRCARLPLGDPEQVLLPRLLDALTSPLPDECMAAAQAVFATCMPRDARAIGEAVERLREQRRALTTTLHSLREALSADRRRLLPVARAVLSALVRDLATASLRVELALWALPFSEISGLLSGMAAGGELYADALLSAVHALSAATARPDAAELEALEIDLSRSDDERLRRLAVAALAAQAQRGFSEERIARLMIYRRDRAPLVAAAAQFLLLPDDR